MNPPVATPFFFYLLSGIMLIGGVLVITRRNAVHSALALIGTLLAQAGLYLMLYAPFVAGVQIILYAGGIMVGLGDGSVRLVNSGVGNPTWAYALYPNDGQPLGSDW